MRSLFSRNRFQQLRRLHLQRPRQPDDINDRNVPLPTLDATNVVAMQIR